MLTNKEAVQIAQAWHSVMTWHDPGVVMYSVSSTGKIHSEEHRKDTIKYIDSLMDYAKQLDETGTEKPVLSRFKFNIEELQALRGWAEKFPIQPQYQVNLVAYHKADEFTKSYIQAALWLCDPTQESGPYIAKEDDIAAIHPDDFNQMIEDCIVFQKTNEDLLEKAYAKRKDYEPKLAGLDFYLTRNRHGSGFWDSYLEDIGDKLTDIAHVWGTCELMCEQGFEENLDESQPRAFYLSC